DTLTACFGERAPFGIACIPESALVEQQPRTGGVTARTRYLLFGVDNLIALYRELILIEFRSVGDGEAHVIDQGNQAIGITHGGQVALFGDGIEILRNLAEPGNRNYVAREHVADPAAVRELAEGGGIVNGAADHIAAHAVLLPGRGAQQAAEVAIVKLRK